LRARALEPDTPGMILLRIEDPKGHELRALVSSEPEAYFLMGHTDRTKVSIDHAYGAEPRRHREDPERGEGT
jgi:hypothetical protein